MEEAYPVFVDKNLPVEAAEGLALFAEAAKKQYTYAHEIEALCARLRSLGRN